MAFEKGNKIGKGRPKGTPNKMTMGVKEAFQHAFDTLGGADKLASWANKNPTEFYKIYSKLIPTDVKMDPTANKLIIEIQTFGSSKDKSETD